MNNYLAFANFSFVPLSHIKDTKNEISTAQRVGSNSDPSNRLQQRGKNTGIPAQHRLAAGRHARR
ncbi:protein of unknown function [Pseudomonas inefficax]|uniref:Uncharacterized protein n=1 Tax=Pseudomonas inefficax TaxID=2078786 RepID=A0AAQ1SS95_9PSED|nr:protein of unknown function [Pseudomonas inefficax]